MADNKDVLERLDRYAKAIARRILRQFDLEHDRHRGEDIAQNLFLAGWQVWKSTGNEGLAKHRMSSRANNEIDRLTVELKQPQPVTSVLPPAGPACGCDATEAYHSVLADLPYRRLRVGASRSSPLEDLIFKEYLEGLPERQRRIVECRLANMTVKEISQTLGVSTSTIERELALLQKGLRREQGA